MTVNNIKVNNTEVFKDEENQKLMELFASVKDLTVVQRLDKSVFTLKGYIDRTSGEYISTSNNEWKCSDYITVNDVSDGVRPNVLVPYLISVASISIGFYRSDYSLIGTKVNSARKIVGYSDLYIYIPENTQYIRLSCLISADGTSEEHNNSYQIEKPYIMICYKEPEPEPEPEYIDQDIEDLKPCKYEYIDLSAAKPGFYDNSGITEGSIHGGCSYLDAIDTKLYNSIYVRLSTYANAKFVEFNQKMERVKTYVVEIKDENKLKHGQYIKLDPNTKFIGLSWISAMESTVFQDETYYAYPADKRVAVLYYDEDYDVRKIDYKDFIIPFKYVYPTDGDLEGYPYSSATDFISTDGYDYLYIKKFSVLVSISVGFYSSNNISGYISCVQYNSVSTVFGDREVNLPNGTKYIRLSKLDTDTEVNDVMYYAVQPYLELRKRKVVPVDVEVPNLNMDFYGTPMIGSFDYALPEDFDYAQILCYGQSFADGGGSSAGSTEVIPNAYMLGSTTRDTTGHFTQLAPGPREFPVVGCVNALTSLYNRKNPGQKFIASTGGGNGRCLRIQSKGTGYFTEMENMFTSIKNEADSLNKSVGLAAVFFLQGESDYTPNPVDVDYYTNDKNEYKQLLLNFKNDIQELAMTKYGQTKKPLFFVYQTSGVWIRSDSYTSSDNITCPMSMAQFELAQEYDDVILITPCYFMTMYNNNHPSINGYRWIGEMTAKAMYQVFNKELRFANAHIRDIKYSGNHVFVSCYVPVPPLRIRTNEISQITNCGFQVREDGTEVTITDVEVYGNVVHLTLSRELDTAKTHDLSYAGRYRSGSGNICDSDNWKSTMLYRSDSGDGTIVQYPKDDSGNPITGKPYPMSNYLGVYFSTF